MGFMGMQNKVPWIFETCARCGKPLKNDQSREAGFGPVCMKKHAADMARAQISIDEYEKDYLPFTDIED